MNPDSHQLEIHADIGALARSLRGQLKRIQLPLAILLMIETAYLSLAGKPGTAAFALISAGCWIALFVWERNGLGLPLLPVIIAQHLIVYGLPIATGHKVLTNYPATYVSLAGQEVLIFCSSLTAVWWLGMQVMTPSRGRSYALHGFKQHSSEKLLRLGFTLIFCSTLFLVLQSLKLLDFFFELLPNDTLSLINPIISASSTGGFFLVSMFVGPGNIKAPGKLAFWLLLALNCFIGAASFLLSSSAIMVTSVAVGLFWSTGRIPWRYVVIVILILSFLNLSKFTMRERYWHINDTDEIPDVVFSEIPSRYLEWSKASLAMLEIGDDTADIPARESKKTSSEPQTLLDRIDNLQNLLFVIDAIDAEHIPLLHGNTYTIIPALLTPRILWPDKPRTHEGQIMLNVHFGRQDLNSTFSTYIAWGLLPEAYGNFGPKVGSLILGVFLGIFCAWIENFTAYKLLLSLEGFVSFTVLLSIMNSYEMVASVLVTSIFQSVISIIVASCPFVNQVDGQEMDTS